MKRKFLYIFKNVYAIWILNIFISSDVLGKKKRYAMLDTLLDVESTGHIDHQGICDEVNTFMFEGYDTTSTCLIFTFLNLALHPDVQDKCRKEIQNLGKWKSLTLYRFKFYSFWV